MKKNKKKIIDSLKINEKDVIEVYKVIETERRI